MENKNYMFEELHEKELESVDGGCVPVIRINRDGSITIITCTSRKR